MLHFLPTVLNIDANAIADTSVNLDTVQPLNENTDQAAITGKINELIQVPRR